MCCAVLWYDIILWSCITSKSLCILAYTSKQHNAAIIHYETPDKRVSYNFKINHTKTTLRSAFNWITKYNIFANSLLHDLRPPCNFMIDLFDCLPVCLSVYVCLFIRVSVSWSVLNNTNVMKDITHIIATDFSWYAELF